MDEKGLNNNGNGQQRHFLFQGTIVLPPSPDNVQSNNATTTTANNNNDASFISALSNPQLQLSAYSMQTHLSKETIAAIL